MTGLQIALPQAKRDTSSVALLGIGAAQPPLVNQADALLLAQELSGAGERERAWLARVFLRSGVETRGSVLIEEGADVLQQLRTFYRRRDADDHSGPGTGERMAQYARHAPVLAETAARQALASAGIAAQGVTHLITASCTGFFAPGLDAALIERLGLRPDIRRMHVGFMGCHAAFNALAAARDAALADRHAQVLVCCVELCSLHFAYGWSPDKLIANSLFGDAAAAAVLGSAPVDPVSESGGWRLRDTASLFLEASREAMAWQIGDHGFAMTLAAELPALVQARLGEWCEKWLARHGLAIADIQGWAIHPGGPKILTAAADSLGIDHRHLRFSRQVLAHYGNVSSATVLLVLRDMAAADISGPCVALGFGPGLMMEALLLER
jgi:predicted naringenin-chalcone synthase